MLDHTLGILAALVGLLIARRLTPRIAPSAASRRTPSDPLAEDDSPREKLPPRSSALPSLLLGVALALAFVVVQHFTARMPEVARVESGVAQAAGSANDLKLTLKNGEVSLPSQSLPVMGPRTAPRRLILMFDYCCPHCREAHHVIRRLQPTAGDEWQVVFVPSPLNSECNPAVEETEPRFKDACTLARLSLAVWKLRPDDWPAFDTWLFDPETPRPAAEARQHAAALYGEIELAEALARPDIDAVIAADAKAYQASGSKVLPVILSPGSAGIAGRTDGEAELRAILKNEFGFPQP
jgi:protein-disulfide isomerase